MLGTCVCLLTHDVGRNFGKAEHRRQAQFHDNSVIRTSLGLVPRRTSR